MISLAVGIRASCGVNGSARMTQGTHAHVSLGHAALLYTGVPVQILYQPHVTLHPRIRIIIMPFYSKTPGWSGRWMEEVWHRGIFGVAVRAQACTERYWTSWHIGVVSEHFRRCQINTTASRGSERRGPSLKTRKYSNLPPADDSLQRL